MATGDPTGAYLCSATISAAVGYKVFTQDSNPTLEVAKKYAIVAETTGLDVSNHLRDRQDTNAGYAGGLKCVSADGGSTWTQVSSRDLWFSTHDTGDVERDNYKTVNAFQAVYGDYHIAQTFTIGFEFDIKSITLWLSKVGDISGGTITCGIKKVEGETYEPPPGKAQNPTPNDDQEDLMLTGINRIRVLTWDAPDGETPDYKVYFRALGDSWELQETITDNSTSHTLSSAVCNALAYYSSYEWRVDTSNPAGSTTGDTWTFITQLSSQFTDYTRPSDYGENEVWQPGTGWVDPNTFEYTGAGRYKARVVVIGHQTVYFGDI